LREHYSKFIGDVYRASNLIVYSGQDNRTVASALAVLAGLFPPTESQSWNPSLPWLPIPVFAMEQLDEVSFGILDHCPYYVNSFNTSKDRAIFEKNLPIAKSLSYTTGVPIYNLDVLQKVIDGIVSRAYLTDLLPLPEWANSSVYIASMKRLEDRLHREYIQILMPETAAWHFDLLISAFDDFINYRSLHKMVLYSAHDTNMMTIAIYLNVSRLNTTLLPTSSYLAFDLSKTLGDEYIVEAFLHEKLNGSREKLIIGLCHEPCLYKDFRGLGSRLNTNDFTALCKETNASSSLYGGIASVLLILTILLLVGLVAAILSCLKWKRQYEALAEEERRPLLTVVRTEDRTI